MRRYVPWYIVAIATSSQIRLIGAAVFLASDEVSGFVTGTGIRVDGGFLATTI